MSLKCVNTLARALPEGKKQEADQQHQFLCVSCHGREFDTYIKLFVTEILLFNMLGRNTPGYAESVIHRSDQ